MSADDRSQPPSTVVNFSWLDILFASTRSSSPRSWKATSPRTRTVFALEGGLLRGWNVETRDPLARIPLPYGENGKPLYGAQPGDDLRRR